MEIMSRLLLCALVAHLPQALGKQSIKGNDKDIKFNTTIVIQQKPFSAHKLLLNMNGLIKDNKIGTVFTDYYCTKCHSCMERAIQAHNYQASRRLNFVEMHDDILMNAINTPRHKRELDRTSNTDLEMKQDKKIKIKKNKVHKAVTVTKYKLNNKVYALKIKESNVSSKVEGREENVLASICQVYSVKKYFPCDSAEGLYVLSLAKSEVDNRSKEGPKNVPLSQTSTVIPTFKQRETDNSQLPDNVMSSVEEVYKR